MNAMWGWVNVYKDGRMSVGERNKQKADPLWTTTSNNPPEDVKRVMAMLDFMRPYESLKGGSNRSTNKHLTTYYIYNADLPKWGWVSVYKDGWMNVGEYSKQKSDQRWAVTSNNPPAEVKTVMAMLDFMRPYESLKGGSNRSTNKHLTTYYIYNADLPKDKEET